MDPTSVDPPLAAGLGNFDDYDLHSDLLNDFLDGEVIFKQILLGLYKKFQDPEQFLSNSADLFERIGFESESIEQNMITVSFYTFFIYLKSKRRKSKFKIIFCVLIFLCLKCKIY